MKDEFIIIDKKIFDGFLYHKEDFYDFILASIKDFERNNQKRRKENV